MTDTSVILEAGIICVLIVAVISLGVIIFLVLQLSGKRTDARLEFLSFERRMQRMVREMKSKRTKKSKASDQEASGDDELEEIKEEPEQRLRTFSYVICLHKC